MKIPKPNYDSPDEHSKYGPSGAKRWMSCPASMKAIEEMNLPKQEGSNFYAEEGTAAHELSAHCLTHDADAITQKYKIFNKFTVDDEMARQTQKYIDYVNGQVTWDSTLWVENRVPLIHLEDTMFGTADAIIWSEDSLEIVDLKYGKGVVVEPEENPQLMLYAIGALAHLAKHGHRYPDHFKVKITIHQPRAPHAEGPVRSWDCTIAQLKDFQKEVKLAVQLTKGKNPPFGPGENQCRWCEAAPTCGHNAVYMLDIAKIEFEEFKEPKLDLVPVRNLTADDLSNIIRHTKQIEQWLKSITEYAIEQLKQSKHVRGYKLVYGRSNRAWRDTTEAEKILLDYGIDEDRLFNRKFLSPTQMEKELTEEQYELVKPIVFKPTGKMTIAKEGDVRKAIDIQQEAKDEWRE